MEEATGGAREDTTYTAIDTQSTSGSLLPMYRAVSCGQQRSTDRSKYGMVELATLSFLPAHILKPPPSSRAVEGSGGTGKLGIVMSSIYLFHQISSAQPGMPR